MVKSKKNFAKPRDYKAEYFRRIALGQSRGLSRSQARGHPKPAEQRVNKTLFSNWTRKLEKALLQMKQGKSQKRAASFADVSTKRLRSFLRANTRATRKGHRWIIIDNRHESFWIASKGRRLEVMLTKEEASKVGLYWNAVNRFLNSNDIDALRVLKDLSVIDMKGTEHAFEMRPNVLRRLESVDELDFLEIYADVAR